jgi:O-antigen/teichoic acid export membrane protein
MKERLISILHWGERYAKTDLIYLTKNTSWLTISQISISLFALLTSIAFAHFIPKEAYGSYRYLLSVFWTLTTFSLTGIPTALARAISKSEDGAYKESIRLSIIWSWPMILISLGLAVYYFAQGNLLLFSGALIIAAIGPLMQPTYLFGSLLEGKRAFRATALAGIVLNLVPMLALIATMFVSQNPLSYLAVYLVANAGTAGVISWYVWKRYRSVEHKPTESLFALGAHFSVMNILAGIAGQIDRLLVFHYLGAIELAVYSFAIALPDQIKAMSNNVATIAFPKFANRPFKEIQETFLHRLGGFTLLMAALAGIYIILAPFAFHILFPAYTEAIWYSQIYALALIPLASIFPATALQAHAANRELYILNIVSSVFQIGILFPAIAYYGLLGAVVARILSRVFNLVLSVTLTTAYARCQTRVI